MLEPDPELAVAYGIFTVRQARDAGFRAPEIRRMLRKGTWHRSARGVLAVAGRQSESGDALVRTYLAAGPHAVVGFETAAMLHGWDVSDPRAPTRLVLPPEVEGTGYRTRLSADDVMLQGILRVTSPSHTALDLAAECDFARGVAVLDSALRSRQTDVAELTTLFARAQRKGVLSARRALVAADPDSGSVPETEARLLFARAGIPAPTSQFVITAGGRFVARTDFGWEFALLAAEIDGFEYHSRGGDFQDDRTRQNAMQLEGWLVLRFTVAAIRFRQEQVISDVWRGLTRPR